MRKENPRKSSRQATCILEIGRVEAAIGRHCLHEYDRCYRIRETRIISQPKGKEKVEGLRVVEDETVGRG